MLIAYSMPEITSVTLSGGSASWLTADAGAACVDGKPARRARFQWRNEASPLPAHRVSITLAFELQQIRVCALLGLRGVPEGAVVHVYGRDFDDAGTTYDFGGLGANVATVRRFADGTYGCWWVLPTTATTVREVEFRIYNDDTGATWADADTVVDVGEIVVMPAVVTPATPDRRLMEPGSTRTRERTYAGQLVGRPGVSWRRLAVAMQPAPVEEVRMAGLDNGMDWFALRDALDRNARCCVIPRYRDTAGAIDADALHATALYGVAEELGEIAHLGADHYSWNLAFEEMPAQ